MIAITLGRTVGELRRVMTRREYVEWMARFAIEPCEASRMDWWNAQILAASVNSPFVANGKKRVVTAKELMPDWWDEHVEKPKGCDGLIAWLSVMSGRS